MKALVFDTFGDAEVLRYREIDEPECVALLSASDTDLPPFNLG
jgi:NADPH:quinone reductase-like Zn-dependent oxidoreductase